MGARRDGPASGRYDSTSTSAASAERRAAARPTPSRARSGGTCRDDRAAPSPAARSSRRRAIVDIVRAAVARQLRRDRLRRRRSRRPAHPRAGSAWPTRASRVGVADGPDGRPATLTVAFGLPVAEVARQVDSAVRYALRRALGREPDRLVDPRSAGLPLRAGASAAPPASDEPGAAARAARAADAGADDRRAAATGRAR